MKKLLLVFALCALSASSFADVSITDWKFLFKSGSLNIGDLSPAGFEFGFTDSPNTYLPAFRSNNVSGWVFDENDTIAIDVDGFEGVGESQSLIFMFGVNGKYVVYTAPYTGAGTYEFCSDDIAYNDGVADDNAIANVLFYVGKRLEGTAAGVNYLPADCSGSVRVYVGGKRPETVVPEPASVAYGVFGLLSAVGLRRKLKK